MNTDKERLEELQLIVDWYCPGDEKAVFHYMPRERYDSTGEQFNDYLLLIQFIYALRGYYKKLTPEELEEAKNEIRLLAAQFDYPTNQLDGLVVKKE